MEHARPVAANPANADAEADQRQADGPDRHAKQDGGNGGDGAQKTDRGGCREQRAKTAEEQSPTDGRPAHFAHQRTVHLHVHRDPDQQAEGAQLHDIRQHGLVAIAQQDKKKQRGRPGQQAAEGTGERCEIESPKHVHRLALWSTFAR